MCGSIKLTRLKVFGAVHGPRPDPIGRPRLNSVCNACGHPKKGHPRGKIHSTCEREHCFCGKRRSEHDAANPAGPRCRQRLAAPAPSAAAPAPASRPQVVSAAPVRHEYCGMSVDWDGQANSRGVHMGTHLGTRHVQSPAHAYMTVRTAVRRAAHTAAHTAAPAAAHTAAPAAADDLCGGCMEL